MPGMYRPAVQLMSDALMPAYRVRTSSSPGPGRGVSTVFTCTASRNRVLRETATSFLYALGTAAILTCGTSEVGGAE